MNEQNKLWTRDFTIITLGSVVSIFGNSLSGFAISLLVLDYTNSSLLYAIYLAAFTIPQIFVPIVSGALLDRFSRKKVIYSLDFLTSFIYFLGAIVLWKGWFNFTILAISCFIIGSINSIYLVAYQSFYPLLISKGNFSKAYSIQGIIEVFAAFALPIATFLYNLIGIAPLLLINTGCFLIAAIFETQIKTKEEYIEIQKKNVSSDGKYLLKDIKEGFNYLFSEKGLLAITAYFLFSYMAGGSSNTVMLPYFKANITNGEYMYTIVTSMSLIGRFVGALIHYKVRIPEKVKYSIAIVVYVLMATVDGALLFMPLPMMIVVMFIAGICSVTSYTIRIASTQNYVPNEKKGRFNAAFNMVNTVGTLIGQLVTGALAEIFPSRLVLLGFMILNGLMAIIIIGGNKKHVANIYNRQQ